MLIEMLVASCSSTCLQPSSSPRARDGVGEGTGHGGREGQAGLLPFWAVIWDALLLCF